jgi:hypothetical protein
MGSGSLSDALWPVVGKAAFVPAPIHPCWEWGRQFTTPGRTRNTVANPLPANLGDLAMLAPQP